MTFRFWKLSRVTGRVTGIFLRNCHVLVFFVTGRSTIRKIMVVGVLWKSKISQKLSTAKFQFLKFVTGYLLCHGLLFPKLSRVYKKMSREKKTLDLFRGQPQITSSRCGGGRGGQQKMASSFFVQNYERYTKNWSLVLKHIFQRFTNVNLTTMLFLFNNKCQLLNYILVVLYAHSTFEIL